MTTTTRFPLPKTAINRSTGILISAKTHESDLEKKRTESRQLKSALETMKAMPKPWSKATIAHMKTIAHNLNEVNLQINKIKKQMNMPMEGVFNPNIFVEVCHEQLGEGHFRMLFNITMDRIRERARKNQAKTAE